MSCALKKACRDAGDAARSRANGSLLINQPNERPRVARRLARHKLSHRELDNVVVDDFVQDDSQSEVENFRNEIRATT